VPSGRLNRGGFSTQSGTSPYSRKIILIRIVTMHFSASASLLIVSFGDDICHGVAAAVRDRDVKLADTGLFHHVACAAR
jgi:hypothetical protein